MSDEKRFRFHIDAYSPADIPMAKLAEYMADFAELLGKEHRVHFDRLEGGSTTIVSRVEREDVPKVDHRLRAVGQGTAEKDLASVVVRIDERLANDNATGRVLEEIDGQSAEVIAFPGRDRPKIPTYGPFVAGRPPRRRADQRRRQGRDDQHPPAERRRHLPQMRDHAHDRARAGQASVRAGAHPRHRPLAARRAGRLAPGSVSASARFEVLEGGSLREAVTALRAVPGSGWKEIDDPLAELADLRGDRDELH